MCCFATALLLFGPRLAILIWWIYTPVYISTLFQTWIWPILGWIFLPWTTLMYMVVAPAGIVGFDWILLGLGVLPTWPPTSAVTRSGGASPTGNSSQTYNPKLT
jgi:hypothetical protein